MCQLLLLDGVEDPLPLPDYHSCDSVLNDQHLVTTTGLGVVVVVFISNLCVEMKKKR